MRPLARRFVVVVFAVFGVADVVLMTRSPLDVPDGFKPLPVWPHKNRSRLACG
jgi:hypothetical protein